MEKLVSVRSRDTGEQSQMSVEGIIGQLKEEIQEKK